MVVKITFATAQNGKWIGEYIAPFEEANNGEVTVDLVSYSEDPFGQLFDTIQRTAESQNSLFSGFITPPSPMGDIVALDGWADLTEFIKDGRIEDWVDILPAYRDNVASYESQILSYPLDGDILLYYYNKNILDAFNLTVPKTWDEYNDIAKVTHGEVFEGQTLSGSCIGRMKGCAGAYWAHVILASMTTTRGPATGSLFNTENMKPLTSKTLERAIQLMEESVKYGAPTEFEKCIRLNIAELNAGTCTQTINWGNQFTEHLKRGSTLRGRLGVAPTPGSYIVLDRESNELKDCTEDLCPYAENHDGKLLNRAPYLAFGGWSCVVSNYADEESKLFAMKFCAFASSAKHSRTISNATSGANGTYIGQDPYRLSQLDATAYFAKGYELETAEEYLKSQQAGLSSPNIAIDTRFPTSPAIMKVLDSETHAYLNAAKLGVLTTSAAQVTANIESAWNDIITDYNNLPTTATPILEIYQRLRGVFVPNLNQLGQIRFFGYVLCGLIMVLSASLCAWTYLRRNTRVVKAAQPFFLIMICGGCFIFVSAIIPLSIDDGIASDETCTKACQSRPWLLCLGFTVIFSALYSKIRRINIVLHSAMSFKSVQVKERDVLVPFGVLFSLNVILLIIWTVLDPFYWKRMPVPGSDGLSTYGSCVSTGKAWLPILCLLVVANFTALVLANVEAYKARDLDIEFAESKYIGMANVLILQAFLIGVPLLLLTVSNQSAAYFVWCTLIFVVSAAVLLFIFVPKLMAARKPSSSGESSRGLTYSVRGNETLTSVYNKIFHLRNLMEKKGIESEELFQEVGLTSLGGLASIDTPPSS